MSFSSFAGNGELKTRLALAFSKGNIGHAFLISGSAGSGKKTLAGLMAAAMQCASSQDPPCLSCVPCNKVMGGIHPDVETILSEKQAITVDLIRSARSDAYIRPNEGKKKVYIIPEAERLNLPAQNAMLKILEEPPPYAVFILITENPAALLSTVRSRCTELQVRPVPQSEAAVYLKKRFPDAGSAAVERAARDCEGLLGRAIAELENGGESEETEGQARAFGNALAEKNVCAMMEQMVSMEKTKREEFYKFLKTLEVVLRDAAVLKTGLKSALSPGLVEISGRLSQNLTKSQLFKVLEAIQTAMTYAESNVGTAHIAGALAADCRGAVTLSSNILLTGSDLNLFGRA